MALKAAQRDMGLVEDPYRMEIVDPRTGDVLRDKTGKAAYIDVVYMQGRALEEAARESFERGQRLQKRGQSESYDERRAQLIDLQVKATKGWYLVDLDGEPTGDEFTLENVREFYATPSLKWIHDQVVVAAGEVRHFIKASSKT